MKLLLIDGNSVLFRGYYATSYGNIMKTSKGVYTNAIYAFAGMLNKAIKQINPDYCVVAFDKGKHTFRHDIAADYKGGRKETPEELVEQFPLVREMLEGYNISYLEYDDIEADDVIGTLAKKYPEIETCILSSDRDLLQLIDDSTSVYVMKKGMSDIAKMDEANLLIEYGLKPNQIIDYKGLAGDKSDNIKGVEGIGDKTAVKLLNQYGNCEGIYEHIDELKGKLKEHLIQDKESCFLSRQLATIKTDVDIDLKLEDFKLNINEQTRNDFFNKYEMYSLITKINNPKAKIEFKKVNKINKELLDNAFIYFMSDDFTYFNREIWGICIGNDKGIEYIDFNDFIKDDDALSYLSSDKKKYVYDLKAILHTCKYNNIEIGKNTDDLMLMAFLINNNLNNPQDILRYYGIDFNQYLKDIVGTEKKRIPYDENNVISYASEFVNNYLNIISKLENDLIKDELKELYEEVELPLLYVLYEMEEAGIYCDIDILDEIAKKTYQKIEQYANNIYKEAGHEFNINSPKQLAEVLFDELDLPNLKNYSTNAEILQKISSYSPIINDILEYRKYQKLYSTYAEGLKKYIGEDNKIHTIFSQNITATGRLSSYDPNLQNISVRDEESREIRKAFLAKEGYSFIASDYSQIELRVLASLADEKAMIDAFNHDIDIHTKTAMDVFGLKEDEVNDLARRKAKAVNFGVVYGISDFGLANQAHLSINDAKEFIENYFDTYPKIKEYLDKQIEYCKENSYVKTILNRRRYINEINEKNYTLREFGKRAAMNSTIQGSAADIIKIAMIKLNETLKKENVDAKIILQVHDELILEVNDKDIDKVSKIIKDVMTNAYKLKVKLDTSLVISKDWYGAK